MGENTVCCLKFSPVVRVEVTSAHTHNWRLSLTTLWHGNTKVSTCHTRLPVVRFTFYTRGRQIAEASEGTSRVTGKKHAAAQSLIIKSVYKSFPDTNFWPPQCQKNQWPTVNLHLASEFLLTSFRCSFCILYTCTLRTMIQFSFSTQLFHSSVIWEKWLLWWAQ